MEHMSRFNFYYGFTTTNASSSTCALASAHIELASDPDGFRSCKVELGRR